MSKLRIDNIDEHTSPDKITKMFENFGKVEEVSIHAGGDLVYALVKMPRGDAEYAINDSNYHVWRARGLRVAMANRCSHLRWLSPDWKPPKRAF
jgi:RNA recognition motif. (a.k.a. RRM, RBD, or RNP domain)